MIYINALRAVCGVLIALPGTLQLVPDLGLTPLANAVLLVLALIGGTVLSQLPPAGRSTIGDLLAEIDSLSDEERADLITLTELRGAMRQAQPRTQAEEMNPHG